MRQGRVVVVGQIARDLVLVVDRVPEAGATTSVRLRRELLGGKGANQAVGLSQLGTPVGLVAVVGDDRTGVELVQQARADGIDVSGVWFRPRTATGLIVDIVDESHGWRYLEDLPDPVLLTASDIRGAADLLRGAGWVSIQLQQPRAAVAAAAEQARLAGAQMVLDGATDDDRILSAAKVLRSDAHETELLTGTAPTTAAAALRAGHDLLRRGPALVALAADPIGNVVVWEDGHVIVPLLADRVVDTTGAGDAFTAGLISALARGAAPESAARLAGAAAAATVGHPGGRPDLSPRALRPYVD